MYHLGDKIALIIFLIFLIIIIVNIKGRDINLKLDSKNEPNNKEKDKNRYTSQKLENNLQNYRENTKIGKKNFENKLLNYKESTKIHKEYKESIKKNKELIKKNKKLYNTIRTLCVNDNDFMELDAIVRIVQNKVDLQTLKAGNERKSVLVTDVEECYKQLKIENKELKKLEQKLRAVRKYDELFKYFECNSNFNSKEMRLSFYNQNVDIKLKDGNILDAYDNLKVCVRQAILHNLDNVKGIRILTDKNNFKDSIGDNYIDNQFPFQNIKSSSYTIDKYDDRDDYVPNWSDDEDLDDNMIHFDAESEVGVMYDDCYENYNSDCSNRNYEYYISDVINLNLPDFMNFRYPRLNILVYNNSRTYQVPKILAFLSFQWVLNNLDFINVTEDKSFINYLKGLSDSCVINKGYDSGYYQGRGEKKATYFCPIGISFCNNIEYYDFEKTITKSLEEVCNLLVELNDFQLSEEARWDALNKKKTLLFNRMYENLNLTTETHKKTSSVGYKSSNILYQNAKDFFYQLYRNSSIVTDIKSLNIKGFYEYNDMCMIIINNTHISDMLAAVILYKKDLSINFCYLRKLDLDAADKFMYINICNQINKSEGWITYEVFDKDDLLYLMVFGNPIYYNFNEKLEKNLPVEIANEFKKFYTERTSYISDYIY